MLELDIALSYSSENRAYVHAVWKSLREKEVSVFYDQDYQVSIDLVGSHLPEEFDSVFRGGSLVSVLFLSEIYLKSKWPKFEEQRSKLGLLESQLNSESKVVIPVTIGMDFEKLPDWLQHIGGISGDTTGPEELAQIIFSKLEMNFCLHKHFRQRVLNDFSRQHYELAISKLEPRLKSAAPKSVESVEWANYLLACAYSRLAEQKRGRKQQAELHYESSLMYFKDWFFSIEKTNSQSINRYIDYVQRDNDLLALRKHRTDQLRSLIGESCLIPSGDRTDCVYVESEILTPSGICLAKNLSIGTEVVSLNIEKCGARTETVSKISELRLFKETNGIEINGKLRCSKTQLIYTSTGKWSAAGQLKVSQKIMGDDGCFQPITSIKYLPHPFQVLHIGTDENPHNYFAQGILCHNQS